MSKKIPELEIYDGLDLPDAGGNKKPETQELKRALQSLEPGQATYVPNSFIPRQVALSLAHRYLKTGNYATRKKGNGVVIWRLNEELRAKNEKHSKILSRARAARARKEKERLAEERRRQQEAEENE